MFRDNSENEMGTKQNGLRELTLDEWELVSGGWWTDGFGNPEIDVVGGRRGRSGSFGPIPIVDFGGMWGGGGADNLNDGGGDSPSEAPPPADEATHDVDVKIDRELTIKEKAAVNALKAFVDRVTPAINAIPDNAVLKLKEGGKITGAEVKALWAKTDYAVNKEGTEYRNGTTRGEADLNRGNPVISFNIDLLVNEKENTGYFLSPGGIEFVALHDFAHLLGAAQAYDIVVSADKVVTAAEEASREQMANTIASAIGKITHETLLSNPVHGYDPAAPTFQVPAPPLPTPPRDRVLPGEKYGGGKWK